MLTNYGTPVNPNYYSKSGIHQDYGTVYTQVFNFAISGSSYT